MRSHDDNALANTDVQTSTLTLLKTFKRDSPTTPEKYNSTFTKG